MDIEKELREICNTQNGEYLRPFRPNPAWKRASVFIVGSNPATPLRHKFCSFDEYWDSLTKHPEVFKRAYLEARLGGESKTTGRVNELCRYLGGINYLVTNAAAYPVEHGKPVPADQWRTGEVIFGLLRDQCMPRAIFAYGSRAQQLIERVFHVSLDPYADPDDQNERQNGCILLCAPHLSGAGLKRGKTYSFSTALPKFASRIREAVA